MKPTGSPNAASPTTLGLDPSQIVALVDDLEGRGLVMRTLDPNDRRNKLIVATDDGRDMCEQAPPSQCRDRRHDIWPSSGSRISTPSERS